MRYWFFGIDKGVFVGLRCRALLVSKLNLKIVMYYLKFISEVKRMPILKRKAPDCVLYCKKAAVLINSKNIDASI